MRNLEIEHHKTTAYNSTGNSVSERINKTIGEVLRCRRGKTLRKTMVTINRRLQETYHRTIGTTPKEVIVNYQKQLQGDPEAKIFISKIRKRSENSSKINEQITKEKKSL